MAFEQPLFVLTGLKAGADLSAKQFRFVKLDSSGDVVVCAGVTDIPIGVLQNKPTSGQAVEVMAIGISKIEGDADLAIGDMIGTSADGQAAAYVAGPDPTKYVVGRVLTENSAAAGLISALVNCMNPHRGA